MIHWNTNPNPELTKTNYRILRCPANRALTGVILDEEWCGTELHFWKGRSMPCPRVACEACEAGHPPRWKGYVHIYDRNTKTTVILEFTERVTHEFSAFVKTYGSLRGAVITARRLNNKPNGPLHVEFAEGRIDGKLLPTPNPLEQTLERIWEVKQTGLRISDDYVAPGAGNEEQRLA